jgi:hypothetical protein
MAHSDWVPPREQDLVDFATKWTVGLVDTENQKAFGWDAGEGAAFIRCIR